MKEKSCFQVEPGFSELAPLHDGVYPSNVGRGYIVRRLLRRVVGAVQADCTCIVYLCVPVCAIQGGGANNNPGLKAPLVSNFDCEKYANGAFNLEPGLVLSLRQYSGVRCGRLIGVTTPEGAAAFVPAIAEVAVALSPGCDPQLQANAERVYKEIEREVGCSVQCKLVTPA